MQKDKKYSYTFDEEHFYETYNSRKAAALAATKHPKYKTVDKFWTAEIETFHPYIYSFEIVGMVYQQASDFIGEYAEENYLRHITEQQYDLLSKKLTNAFNAWAKETNHEPDFYAIEDIQEHKIE